MVVLPALSSPSTRIRASVSPNRLNSLDTQMPCTRPAAGRHVSDLGVLVRKGGRTRLQAAHHWARETIDGCVAAGVRSVPLLPVWEGNGVPVSDTNAAEGTSRCPAGPCCPMLRFLAQPPRSGSGDLQRSISLQNIPSGSGPAQPRAPNPTNPSRRVHGLLLRLSHSERELQQRRYTRAQGQQSSAGRQQQCRRAACCRS